MKGFKRHLSALSVWGLAFGYAVGWGAFVLPGAKFLPDAGPLGTTVGVLIGALVMAVIGWNYYKMASRESGAGGAYAYATKALGADYGFLTAWSLSLAYMAILWANATALVILVRYVFGDFFQFGWHSTVAGFDVYFGEAILSVGMILLSGICCLCHRKIAGRLQMSCAIFMLVSIAVCFGFAAYRHEGGLASMAPAFSPNGTTSVTQVLRILSMMPWAFVGFEAITHSAPEFKFAMKRLWLILVCAIIASSAAYILLTLMPILSHPEGYSSWTDYIRDASNLAGLDNMPTFAAVRGTMGKFGVGLLAATMVAAIHTGITATIVAMSRLLCAVSSEGVLPHMRWLGRLTDSGTPRNAILFIMAISVPIPFFGRTVVGWPVDVSSIGAAVAYCYTSAAALKFAIRNNDMVTKVTGAVGVVMSIIFCLLLLLPNYLSTSVLSAEAYLVLVIWCILGFLLYRRVFRLDTHRRFGRSPVVWLGILIMIFFSSLMWVRLSSQTATDSAVEAIVHHSARHCAEMHGVANAAALHEETTFVTDEMDLLNNKQLIYDVVQMAMLSFSLVIVFGLYSIQRRREENLMVAQAKAEARDRAKSAFLSSISHDIRTPMNAIIGYIQLAKKDGVSGDKLQSYLEKIDSSSQHLLALLNDVLEMSRIESGRIDLEPTPMDLGVVFREIDTMFGAQMAAKNLAFEIDLSRARHMRVMCDRNRLNRVLINLVSNALKFTPSGGRVEVTLSEFEGDKSNASEYEICVRDTGMGMSEDFQKRVFDAFERDSNANASGIEGTGLGMPITKGIIDLMKGTISVRSELGKGTEFTVRVELPFAPEKPLTDIKDDEGEDIPLEPIDFSKKRLLVVEDNEINREIAQTLLSQAGFMVDVATNGKDAIEKIYMDGARHYDAILMDVHMPVMDGYVATRTIRAMELPDVPRVPIIALSANAFESDVRDALAAGMDAHVAKPIKLQKLLGTLEDLLRRHDASVKAGLKGDILHSLARMGCDVETALKETYVGDTAFYLKMLMKMSKNNSISRMRKALDSFDAKALFDAAHNLKGMYALLGLTPLHALCSEIVEIARVGSFDGVGELLSRLEVLHAKVLGLIGDGISGKTSACRDVTNEKGEGS